MSRDVAAAAEVERARRLDYQIRRHRRPITTTIR